MDNILPEVISAENQPKRSSRWLLTGSISMLVILVALLIFCSLLIAESRDLREDTNGPLMGYSIVLFVLAGAILYLLPTLVVKTWTQMDLQPGLNKRWTMFTKHALTYSGISLAIFSMLSAFLGIQAGGTGLNSPSLNTTLKWFGGSGIFTSLLLGSITSIWLYNHVKTGELYKVRQ
jgi:hypothetical protein